MSDTKAVLRKLLADHVGHSNAITQSQLLEATGVQSDSTLRTIIEELRDERNIPICNYRDGKGYFVAANEEEFRQQIGKLNKRKQTTVRRIESIRDAWNAYDPDDIEIEPETEVQEQTYPCSDCGNVTPKSNCYWPKDGEHAGTGPYCQSCFGELVIAGEA